MMYTITINKTTTDRYNHTYLMDILDLLQGPLKNEQLFFTDSPKDGKIGSGKKNVNKPRL